MKKDKAFISHILDEINYLLEETRDLDYESLMKSETLKRALIRSLEVIGEATKNLSKEFREKYPNIEWKEIAGLRDKLIHSYFNVDWDIVWDVVTNLIPNLKGKIDIILKEMDN